jgi:hypothetical protein
MLRYVYSNHYHRTENTMTIDAKPNAAELRERLSRLLEQGGAFHADGLAFKKYSRLFIGEGEHPDLGLYFDPKSNSLRVFNFGFQSPRLLFIPFNFDLDPPLSKAESTARTEMLVMAGSLREGSMPEFDQSIEEFAARES